MEAILKNLWAEILDQQVSVVTDDANFFELGGDSVAAIRLIEAAREQQIDVELEDVFDVETFKQMLDVCEEKGSIEPAGVVNGDTHADDDEEEEEDDDDMVSGEVVADVLSTWKIHKDELEDILPCLLPVETFYSAHLEQGRFLFQVSLEAKDADMGRLREAWEAVHQRNSTLRSRIIKHGSQMYMVIVKRVPIWQETSHNLQDYTTADIATKMELGMPLSRSAVIHEGDRTYLVWSINHAAKDGWSNKLAMQELQKAYEDPAAYAQSPPLPQYRDFVKWYLRTPVEKGIEHWRNQLNGVKHVDYLWPAAAKRTYDQKKQTISFKTLQLAKPPRGQITASTIFHVAFALVLAKWSGADDILFLSFRSARQVPVPGVREMIAPLMTSTPFRLRLHDPSQLLSSLLRSSQEAVVAGMPYEPYGKEVVNRYAAEQDWPREWSQLTMSIHPPDVQAYDKDIPLKRKRDDEAVVKDGPSPSPSPSALLRPVEARWSPPWQFPLLFEVFSHPREEEIVLKARHDMDLIDRDRCQQLFDEFGHISQLLAHPDDQVVGDVLCRREGESD